MRLSKFIRNSSRRGYTSFSQKKKIQEYKEGSYTILVSVNLNKLKAILESALTKHKCIDWWCKYKWKYENRYGATIYSVAIFHLLHPSVHFVISAFLVFKLNSNKPEMSLMNNQSIQGYNKVEKLTKGCKMCEAFFSTHSSNLNRLKKSTEVNRKQTFDYIEWMMKLGFLLICFVQLFA